MNLAALLGDDEHTATQDAYSRALKSRKWLIAAVAIFIAVQAGFFAPSSFDIFFGKVTVASWTWPVLAKSSLLYAVVINALLAYQLATHYPTLLKRRYQMSRWDEADRLGDEAQLQQAQLTELENRLRTDGPSQGLLSQLSHLRRRSTTLKARLDYLEALKEPGANYWAAEMVIDFARTGTPWLAVIAALRWW